MADFPPPPYHFAGDLPGETWRRYPCMVDGELASAPILVSDRGRVRSYAWGRFGLLSPFPNPGGYAMVNWRVAGRRFSRLVSRMVLETFVGPPPSYKRGVWHACHEDDDRRNNRLTNLRWDTPRGNQADAFRARRGPRKLSDAAVRDIDRRLRDGWSQAQLARHFKVSQVAIAHISTGRTYGRLTGRTHGESISASGQSLAAGNRVRTDAPWHMRGLPHYGPPGDCYDR